MVFCIVMELGHLVITFKFGSVCDQIESIFIEETEIRQYWQSRNQLPNSMVCSTNELALDTKSDGNYSDPKSLVFNGA